jgi:hypothetical protein
MNERMTAEKNSVHSSTLKQPISSLERRRARLSVHERTVMAKIIDADRFREKSAARSAGGSGGGKVDDILKRPSIVESLVGEMRVDVGAIKATLPHLATKADIMGSSRISMHLRRGSFAGSWER